MTNERRTLLDIADTLLRMIPRDPEGPHYRERTFEYKLKRGEIQARKLRPPQNRAGHDYLFRQEWVEILRRANLTKTQWEVFLGRAQGDSFELIGLKRGHSKQGAQHILRQAAAKIVASRRNYVYCGMTEVYREMCSRRR